MRDGDLQLGRQNPLERGGQLPGHRGLPAGDQRGRRQLGRHPRLQDLHRVAQNLKTWSTAKRIEKSKHKKSFHHLSPLDILSSVEERHSSASSVVPGRSWPPCLQLVHLHLPGKVVGALDFFDVVDVAANDLVKCI